MQRIPQSNSVQLERKRLRQQILFQRSLLSNTQQQQASQNIIQPALALIEQYQVSHLAFYLPFQHEISPLALMDILQKQGKSLYLPIMHPFSAGNLLFAKYDSHTVLEKHKWGIWQPKLDVRNVIPLSQIEMIFTPLVGVDKQLNRLGYGGGFYDRTFAQAPNILRIGLAHQCQCVEILSSQSWDKSLHHLIIG